LRVAPEGFGCVRGVVRVRRLVAKERPEALGREVRVAHRVTDVLMADVLLDRARIVPGVRKVVPERGALLVRVQMWQPDLRTEASHDLAHVARRHRPTSFGVE
jgi:hypothetical protein